MARDPPQNCRQKVHLCMHPAQGKSQIFLPFKVRCICCFPPHLALGSLCLGWHYLFQCLMDHTSSTGPLQTATGPALYGADHGAMPTATMGYLGVSCPQPKHPAFPFCTGVLLFSLERLLKDFLPPPPEWRAFTPSSLEPQAPTLPNLAHVEFVQS